MGKELFNELRRHAKMGCKRSRVLSHAVQLTFAMDG